MVAEDRFNLFLRLDSPTLIDLGNWQVELRSAITKYLQSPIEIAASNDHADAEATASRSILDA